MGQRELDLREEEQRLVEAGPAEPRPIPWSPQDARVKEHRDPKLLRLLVHREHHLIVGIPVFRDHLTAHEALLRNRALEFIRGPLMARLDPAEAQNPLRRFRLYPRHIVCGLPHLLRSIAVRGEQKHLLHFTLIHRLQDIRSLRITPRMNVAVVVHLLLLK